MVSIVGQELVSSTLSVGCCDGRYTGAFLGIYGTKVPSEDHKIKRVCGSFRIHLGHYDRVTVTSENHRDTKQTGEMSSSIASRILHIEAGLLSRVSIQRTGNVDDIHPLGNNKRARVASRSRANPHECAGD